MYGHRARIGYTVAAVTTEVFPIDFYKIVPDGVSLMMVMLPLGERSAKDVEKCYDASIAGRQDARRLRRRHRAPRRAAHQHLARRSRRT